MQEIQRYVHQILMDMKVKHKKSNVILYYKHKQMLNTLNRFQCKILLHTNIWGLNKISYT